MVWTGIGAGVALAIVGALIAAAFAGGGGGSLATKAEPTSVVSDGGGAVDAPTDVPVLETPAEAPTAQSTEEPIATEPAPTEGRNDATPTEAPVEQPTDVPTVVGGA